MLAEEEPIVNKIRMTAPRSIAVTVNMGDISPMSLRKPFHAKPVILGEYARDQNKRARRKQVLRLTTLVAMMGAGFFAIGMIFRNWQP